ncbi:MAG: hypothetical protein M3N68_04375 [Actinomycetota bacterium]|nr:hypothetical protein [Actinomycetota bacterium]
MATDPPPDLELTPLNGPPRTVKEWLTTFHLVFVAIDPYTNESAWLLATSARILLAFREADCRIAWLVAGDPEACRAFLGPLADEILTFADPDLTAIKAFGLERLPALVHLGIDGTVMGSAEGWEPPSWRAVTVNLARVMSWLPPVVPHPDDPGPFEGSPAIP